MQLLLPPTVYLPYCLPFLGLYEIILTIYECNEGLAPGLTDKAGEEIEFDLDYPEGYPFCQKDETGKNIILYMQASGTFQLLTPHLCKEIDIKSQSNIGRPLLKSATLEKLVERLTFLKYSGTTILHMPRSPKLDSH